ncbi:hypothetical protein [Neobacillus sp. 19]|uniref:hypothetical protein n=1 Tax=Neobacillus sp. 19 TaxID=3394458 RepID=UPI003BF763B2
MGKYSTNRYANYYMPTDVKDTSLLRQINRLKNDPIRYYEGENEKVSLQPIKAVRLG